MTGWMGECMDEWEDGWMEGGMDGTETCPFSTLLAKGPTLDVRICRLKLIPVLILIESHIYIGRRQKT